MRKLVLLALVGSLALAGCKKSEDAPDANAPPSSTPPSGESVTSEPSTPADEAQEPAATVPKSGGEPAEPEANGLDQKAEYKSAAEAETALSNAKGELDKLLSKPGGGAEKLSVGDSRCADACKAFASMKRAADAVCRLAGDADTRCKKARTLLKDSEGRVAVCKCEG